MLIRIALLACAFAAAPLAAQAPVPAPSTAPAPKGDLVPVAIDTNMGRIVVALDQTHAPVTTANFLRYVDAHRFDGEAIFRAMHAGDSGGLIQGGIQSDARKLFKPIAHEPTSVTGIKHVAGTISMARLAPGTATADFFILTTDIPGFDAGAPGGDPDGFAAFGHVIEGMDVVNRIFALPVSPTKGEGVMKGQLFEQPVKIIKAARVN
jgi:peptidyl-prolyl cis-trans isomerase A (cyclophilin A)